MIRHRVMTFIGFLTLTTSTVAMAQEEEADPIRELVSRLRAALLGARNQLANDVADFHFLLRDSLAPATGRAATTRSLRVFRDSLAGATARSAVALLGNSLVTTSGRAVALLGDSLVTTSARAAVLLRNSLATASRRAVALLLGNSLVATRGSAVRLLRGRFGLLRTTLRIHSGDDAEDEQSNEEQLLHCDLPFKRWFLYQKVVWYPRRLLSSKSRLRRLDYVYDQNPTSVCEKS